jgi:hypothetical protein
VTLSPGDFPDWIRPSSNVYAILFDGAIGGVAVVKDVGQFASVHVLVYNLNGTSLLTARYFFEAPDNTGLIEQGILSCNAVDIQGVADPVWSLPVVAPNLKLEGPVAGTRAKVIGTSQPVRKKLGGDFVPARSLVGTIAANAPSGTTANLVDPAGLSSIAITVPDAPGYNGEVLYQWSCSAGGVTGDFFMDYYDANANLQSVKVFQNVTTTLARLLSGHPYAFAKWRFVSNAVAPAVATPITLTIIPATPAI